MSEPTVQQLLPSDTSHIKDPVQKALVDNILGNLPTKNSQEKLSCDLCKIDVNGRPALLTHLTGARHAKRLKEEKLSNEIDSPHIEYNEESRMYECKLCNTVLNAKIQICAHLQGSKHRTKAGTKDPNAPCDREMPKPSDKPVVPNDNPGAVSSSTGTPAQVKTGPKIEKQLYCPVCNLHANSEQQLQQHVTSKKHLNKIQIKSSGYISKPRALPYPTRPPKLSSHLTSYLNNKSNPHHVMSSPGVYSRRNAGGGNFHNSCLNDISDNFLPAGIYNDQYGPGNHHSYRQTSYQHHTYG